MAGDEKPGSWWQTVPGVLTAIAGIIGAVSGLIVALHQAGIFGGEKEKPAREPAPSAVTQKAAPAPHPPKTAERELSVSPPYPTPRVVLRASAAVLSRDEVARMVAPRAIRFASWRFAP